MNRSVIHNSIVANNRVGTTVDNCSLNPLDLVSLGYNLSDTDASDCDLTAPGDLVNTDPLLGALADNGGLTRTHALLIGNPAIDTGDTANCNLLDQRAFLRPTDGDNDGTPSNGSGQYRSIARRSG